MYRAGPVNDMIIYSVCCSEASIASCTVSDVWIVCVCWRRASCVCIRTCGCKVNTHAGHSMRV